MPQTQNLWRLAVEMQLRRCRPRLCIRRSNIIKTTLVNLQLLETVRWRTYIPRTPTAYIVGPANDRSSSDEFEQGRIHVRERYAPDDVIRPLWYWSFNIVAELLQ